MCPIMSKKQTEEKVIEELEKEGNLKIESQEGGGKEYEDERARQGYNCITNNKKATRIIIII